MRRVCWIFPDRSMARQRNHDDEVFWRPYARAAEVAGLALSYHPPEHVVVDATTPAQPRCFLDGEAVTPDDTMFVTDLYTFPHQIVDVLNQVTLFAVLEHAGFYLPIPPRLSFVGNDKVASLIYLGDSPIPAIPSVRIPTGRGVADDDVRAH